MFPVRSQVATDDGERHADATESALEAFPRSSVAAMTAPSVDPRTLWDADVVPLPTVARVANVPPMDLHNAVRRGHLHPVGRVTTASGRPALITREEAVSVLMASALAVAAGIVFSSALRAVLAGATFPLPGADAAA